MTDSMWQLERDVRSLAETARRNAERKGFDVRTWENLPGSLLFVVGELDEITRSTTGYASELADTAIRTLTIMQTVFPDWRLRQRVGEEPWSPHLATLLECDLWPVVRWVSIAGQAWRHQDRDKVCRCLENVIAECFRLAGVFRVDLVVEIERKLAVNEARPHLHGSVETL